MDVIKASYQEIQRVLREIDANPVTKTHVDELQFTLETRYKKLANDPLKDVINYVGMQIGIEWPAGSIRTWEGSDYSRFMHCAYGYVRSTTGEDGEEMDVYVGSNLEGAEDVYELEQLSRNGSFDEYKYMIGFNSSFDAKEMFLKHMDPEQMGKMSTISPDDFVQLSRMSITADVERLRKDMDRLQDQLTKKQDDLEREEELSQREQSREERRMEQVQKREEQRMQRVEQRSQRGL